MLSVTTQNTGADQPHHHVTLLIMVALVILLQLAGTGWFSLEILGYH